MRTIRIGSRQVGGDHPTYFVADVAANHDGSLDRARMLVRLAAEAGADAAKFQHFRADTIVSDVGFAALGDHRSHQSSWDRSVVEVYRDAAVPSGWTPALRAECDAAGIAFMTTPYDIDLVDELAPYVAAWKIGSGDITWHEEIARVSSTGHPVMLATGASTLAEVRAAVAVAAAHTDDLVLMQCNTNYTGDPDNFRHIELRVLTSFARRFPGVVLGLSDHTPGHATVLGAVALGARVVEKHFTDDPRRTGPDHAFSMDPAGWRDMVARTRELELALGTGRKRVMDNERDTVVLQRRALRAARDLPAATVVAATDLVPLRPCPPGAVPPHAIGTLVGRTTRRPVARGDCVTERDLA